MLFKSLLNQTYLLDEINHGTTSQSLQLYQAGLLVWPRVAIPTSLWGLVLNRLKTEFQANRQVLSIGRSMLMKGIVPPYKEWNLSHPNTVSWISFFFSSLFVLRKNKQIDFLKERTCPNIWLPFIYSILKSLLKTTYITREALNSAFELICSAMPQKNADWIASLSRFPGTGALERTEDCFLQHKRQWNIFALFSTFLFWHMRNTSNEFFRNP